MKVNDTQQQNRIFLNNTNYHLTKYVISSDSTITKLEINDVNLFNDLLILYRRELDNYHECFGHNLSMLSKCDISKGFVKEANMKFYFHYPSTQHSICLLFNKYSSFLIPVIILNNIFEPNHLVVCGGFITSSIANNTFFIGVFFSS